MPSPTSKPDATRQVGNLVVIAKLIVGANRARYPRLEPEA